MSSLRMPATRDNAVSLFAGRPFSGPQDSVVGANPEIGLGKPSAARRTTP